VTSCPHCQAPLALDARFCGGCGRAAVLTASDSKLPVVVDPMGAMIGQEIAGRFRILAKLGEGGMGAVFRAEQISLKRIVAVKLLQPSLASSVQLIRRFNAEAQAIAQLNHPNTVGIYDFGEHAGMLFIAMELIEGSSLRDVIHRDAPLSPWRALYIASQVAASLADAHAHGIIHRDLKPDNVMLQQRGKARDVARVLDFGIAKLRNEARGNMTQAGDILGTPQYIAPEQAKGEAIDGRTDIYALGCMLYEMVTARLPFEGTSVMALLAAHVSQPVVPPSQRRPELAIPPALDQLVVWAMQKDPAGRPPTMEALGEQMAQILATLPPEAGLTAAQSVQSAPWPAVTPTGSAAPMVTPMSPSAPGMVLPPAPPLTPPPPAPRSHRGAIAAVLGVLAAGAIGTGIYFATRSAASPSPSPISGPGPIRTPDPGPGPGPGPTPASSPDAAAVPAPAPDAATAPAPAFDPSTQGPNLPPGAMLIAAPGYTQTRTDTADKLVDAKRNIYIELQPINDVGDIRTLAQIVAQQQSMTIDHIGTVTSAGKPRDAAWFSGTPSGVPIKMMLVLYDGPSYRIACFGAEPTAIWDEDGALQFFAENVAMP